MLLTDNIQNGGSCSVNYYQFINNSYLYRDKTADLKGKASEFSLVSVVVLR